MLRECHGLSRGLSRWTLLGGALLRKAKQSMDACDVVAAAASRDAADSRSCANEYSRPCCSGPQDTSAANSAASKRSDAGAGCVDSLAMQWLYAGSASERSPRRSEPMDVRIRELALEARYALQRRGRNAECLCSCILVDAWVAEGTLASPQRLAIIGADDGAPTDGSAQGMCAGCVVLGLVCDFIPLPEWPPRPSCA